MGAISQRSAGTWYGTSTWNSRSDSISGGSANYKNAIQFGSLSGGKPITSLTLTFNKKSTNSGTYTMNIYASATLIAPPTSFNTGTFVQTFSWSRPSAGSVVLTFNESAMAVLSQFTGTWYLMFESPGPYETTFTGGSGSSAPLFSGEYSEGSMHINVGGVWRQGNPHANVSGVWRSGVQYINVNGVWKQGIA